tara:strand:+ start:1902 stop:2369 length:468 start_codon:yes stop_codon:yes gene_type:complete
LDAECKKNLESIIKNIAVKNGLKLYELNIKTNHNPITIQVTINKIDGSDISISDCSDFNDPVEQAIESSKLLNCSYVLEISSQGVSDELTSNRDFKTFKGFPVNVELNHADSKLKNLNGLLYEKSKDYLAINIKGKIKKIPFNEVFKVSLATIKD